MDFALTPEQQRLQTEIRTWVDAEIRPQAEHLDEAGVYPLEIMRSAAARGFTTITLPAAYGGMGLGAIEECILMEEAAAASAIVGISLITIYQAQTMLQLYGSERVKAHFLPQFREGLISSYALTEPRHGSDIRTLDTKATRDGEGWVLNGRKAFITSASAAGLFVILAETDAGVTVFVTERDREGVFLETPDRSETIGLRNGPHMDARLSACRLPEEYLIGTEGKGVRQAVVVLDHSRVAAAAISLGIAQAAYTAAERWVMHRKAFDQHVFDFQGIQWKFADMRIAIEAARLLTYRAAWLLDQGQLPIEASSMAKVYASEVATKCALEGMQVCGLNGISVNAPFGRYLRDAKAYEVAGGSSEILRNTIAKQIRKAYNGGKRE